jgi:5-methylcytosine-specific restriction endonuclease McrA
VSKGWGKGSTRRWRKTRAAVLLRDGYLCQLRIPGICTVGAPLRGGHVHHTQGKQLGDDMRFLVASCRACNLHIGDPAKRADPPNEAVTKW